MPKELECPKCMMQALDRKKITNIEIDECPKCRGRWYDFSELAKLVKDPAKFEEATKAGPLKPRPGDRDCPRCNRKMVNGGLINEFLRVDLCSKCQGMWLDGSELHLVDKLLSA